MYDNKTIREAKYLKKDSGDYISFRLKIKNTDCA